MNPISFGKIIGQESKAKQLLDKAKETGYAPLKFNGRKESEKDFFVKDRDVCKTWGGGTIMGF